MGAAFFNNGTISQQDLERFMKNKKGFVHPLVTMDETWIYQHDPNLQHLSERFIHLRVLETGKSIIQDYHRNFYDQLDMKINEGGILQIFKTTTTGMGSLN